MTTRAIIVVAFVVAALLLFARRASASSRPAAPSDAIARFADAIARAEGFGVDGAIPTRANNPGDLNAGAPTLTGTSITVYPSASDGWSALYSMLTRIRDGRSSRYFPTMTIAEMAANYAPFDADTWAGNVASILGVSTSTQIGALL